MKNLLAVLGIAFVLAMTGCGRVESEDPTASIDKSKAAVAADNGGSTAGTFAGAFFVGTFHAMMYGNTHSLVIDDNGNVAHSACQAVWKILELNPNATPDSMKFNVVSTQGYAECPSVGIHVCTLKKELNGAGTQIGIFYNCSVPQQQVFLQ